MQKEDHRANACLVAMFAYMSGLFSGGFYHDLIENKHGQTAKQQCKSKQIEQTRDGQRKMENK